MASGIYQILNTTNGHCYIGQAHDLEGRKKVHFRNLRNGKYGTTHWQNAFNKYGKETFEFIVLRQLRGYQNRNALNLMLTAWEQYFMDFLHPEYNTNPIAGRSGGSHHNEETRRKMSRSHMGLAVGKQNPSYGDHRTYEERFGPERAAEIRKKLKKSCIGHNSGEQNGNYGDHRTYEERYGRERAAEIKQKISNLRVNLGLSSGKRNPNYGNRYTWDTRFGLEKAAELRRKKSETMKRYWAKICAAKNQNAKEDKP